MNKIGLLLLSILFSASALTLPRTIYKPSTITPESAYSIYKQIQEAKKFYKKGNLKESTPRFIRIVLNSTKSNAEKNIDQYDYLYAHYAILAALKRDEKDEKNYILLAKKILRYLDKSTAKGIWEEGELGQFQMKVYRDVGNALANILYKNSKRTDKKKMKEAKKYIEKAEKYIRSEDDFYIKETKEKITNALAGNPPLKSEEKKLKIIKRIKSNKEDSKTLQNHLKEKKFGKNLEKSI